LFAAESARRGINEREPRPSVGQAARCVGQGGVRVGEVKKREKNYKTVTNAVTG